MKSAENAATSKSPGRQTKQKLLGKRLCYAGQRTYQRPFRGTADNERQKDEPASRHRYRRSGRNPGQSRVKRHCPVKRRQLLLLRQHRRHRPRPPVVYHLRASEKVSVKAGDYVRQGQVIGEVGKTGRVTGPHLHWGASLNGVHFTPESLLHMNNADFCFNL